MVEINHTCIKVVDPREIYIEIMIYEVTEEMLENYAQIILNWKRDEEFPRWGTYEEKYTKVGDQLYNGVVKKKVDKKIKKMIKD